MARHSSFNALVLGTCIYGWLNNRPMNEDVVPFLLKLYQRGFYQCDGMYMEEFGYTFTLMKKNMLSQNQRITSARKG